MQHTLQAPPLEMQPRSGFKATLAHGTGIDRQDGQDMLATPRLPRALRLGIVSRDLATTVLPYPTYIHSMQLPWGSGAAHPPTHATPGPHPISSPCAERQPSLQGRAAGERQARTGADSSCSWWTGRLAQTAPGVLWWWPAVCRKRAARQRFPQVTYGCRPFKHDHQGMYQVQIGDPNMAPTNT